MLVVSGDLTLWMVFVLAFTGGCVFALDQPARQLYVVNLVGRDRVASAVGLYEVILNASRVLGPAVGGVVLAFYGVAACFFVNAASFVLPLLVLLHYKPHETHAQAAGVKAKTRDALRAGIAYVRRTPAIGACLLMAGATGMVLSTSTALPVLATQTFGFGKAGLGALAACFGLGAIPGGLAAAYTRNERIGSNVRVLCLCAGVAVLALAFTPVPATAFLFMLLVGFFAIWTIALANTLVQVRSDPSLRGPVMGLWTMVLPGLVPVTALLAGAVTQFVGPRAGYGLAGVVLCIAAAAGWRALSEA